MMRLKELIKDIDPQRVVGCDKLLEQEISALTFDSRAATQGAIFFALRGEVTDGHLYINGAVASGARCVVCESLPQEIEDDVAYIVVESSHVAMGRMASAFYGYPSRDLKLVGITGTNGKTTTATLMYDLFRALGYKAGLLSTVVYMVDTERVESSHTTPDAIRLNAMLREMVERGCAYCFMEVSSHAIAQHRIEGLEFDGAIFSNLTRDHLDYHKTFSEYLGVKRQLFDSLGKGAFALTNIDDRNGLIMTQNSRAKVSTYSLRSMADFRAKVVEMHFDGMLLRLDGEEVWVHFIGAFNAYNVMAGYATARLLGVERSEILVALSQLTAASGRFEYMRAKNGTTIIVDYAHTPDALENVIGTINQIRQPAQDLIVVCGCGGDRDSGKRPQMARVATDNSQMAIFTSDNPRGEDPEEILRQMMEGVSPTTPCRHLKITDRAEAIRAAVMMSKGGDIILIAGKGHETYQIIGGEKHHFDDREVAREAMEQYIK